MNLLLPLLLLFVTAQAQDVTPEQIEQFHQGQVTIRERDAINSNRKPHTMDKLIKIKERLGVKGFAEELEKRRAALKKLSEVMKANSKPISKIDLATIEQMKKWTNKDSYASKGSILNMNREVAEYLYEGDILLPSENIQQLIAQQTTPPPRAKRGTPLINIPLWNKSQPIPYFFDTREFYTHTTEQMALIRESIRQIEMQTCIRFEENDKPENKILVTNGNGCSSELGMFGGTQTLSLRDNYFMSTCVVPATIQHEFLHALGISHTQNRYDRDQYVTVNEANIYPDDRRQFRMRTEQENDNFGIRYDYGSVMHYEWNAFALDSNIPTLIPKNAEYMFSMGQKLALTYNDIRMVNALYKCHESCPTKIDCGGARGYQNPKNCNVCICNEFFRGSRCEIANYDPSFPYNFRRNINPVTKKEDWAIAVFKPDSRKEAADPEIFAKYQHDYSHYTKYFYSFTMMEIGYEMHFELIIDNPAFQCTEGCFAGGITIIESDVKDDFSYGGKKFCCFQQNGHIVKTKSKYVGVKVVHAPGINSEFTVKAYPVAI